MKTKYICDVHKFLAPKYISRAVEYMSNIFWRIYLTIKKIYAKYIPNIQLSVKIYFIYFDIYVAYICYYVGSFELSFPPV